MNFRNLEDLSRAVVRNLDKISPDVDLVVGIPRSGLLAASLVALHRNLPLADVAGLIEGRLLDYGRRLAAGTTSQLVEKVRKVLVLDDSANSGDTLRNVRERLNAAHLPYEILYGAIYVTASSIEAMDFYCEVVPAPRLFSWNVMNHPLLDRCCVDIDGVLCRDPRPAENDDGPGYRHFLEHVEPLFLPTQPIGWLVSSRLECYRSETEQWLARHGVRYRELVLLDLPDAATRRAKRSHAPHKATAYASTNALLFIESEPFQADAIADASGRPVLCLSTQRLSYPGGVRADLDALARRGAAGAKRRSRALMQTTLNRLLHRKPAEP